MIAAIKVSVTEFILLTDHTEENPSKRELPKAAMPPGITYRANAVPGNAEAVFVNFFTEGVKNPTVTLWNGPYRSGPDTYYIVNMPESSMEPIGAVLGVNSIGPFTSVMRGNSNLRSICNDLGLGQIENSEGEIIGFYPPLVICGQPPYDEPEVE